MLKVLSDIGPKLIILVRHVVPGPETFYHFSDKTNVPPAKRALDNGRPLCGIKRKKEDENTSCSPLFAPSRAFKKGFTSSASSAHLKGKYD